MKKTFLLALVLVFLYTGTALADVRDSATWWIETYGTVSELDDPWAVKAQQVFARVAAAADKCSNRFPRLVIIEGDGAPYAVAIRDGSIILTHGAIRLCYQGVSNRKGDARLAFLLGHELAHQAKDHFWHQAAFESVQEFSTPGKKRKALLRTIRNTSDVADDTEALEHLKSKELEADSFGIAYAVMAGYDPAAVVAADGTDFFTEWVSQVTGQIAYDDPHHHAPEERAEFLRSQLARVVDNLDYFRFGMRLYQVGAYQDTLNFLERFKEFFPSREVFSNIGLAHYQIAQKNLARCDTAQALPFKLPALVDANSLAMSIPTRGVDYRIKPGKIVSLGNHCRYFHRNILEAKKYFEMAVSKDPSYLPARVNLASALILTRDYSQAMAISQQTLDIAENYLPAMVTQGVALYLFGNKKGVDMSEIALGVLKGAVKIDSSCGDALYNIAAILQDHKRPAAAREAWRNYLKVADDSQFAAVARKAAGLPPRTKKCATGHMLPFDSPVRLGPVSKTTLKQLDAMESKVLPTAKGDANLYRGPKVTVYAFGDTVEIVETELSSPLDWQKFRQQYGAPLRVINGPAGSTYVYRGFAADVVEGHVVKVVFFEA